MPRQVRHLRRSKYGKRFVAGSRFVSRRRYAVKFVSGPKEFKGYIRDPYTGKIKTFPSKKAALKESELYDIMGLPERRVKIVKK